MDRMRSTFPWRAPVMIQNAPVVRNNDKHGSTFGDSISISNSRMRLGSADASHTTRTQIGISPLISVNSSFRRFEQNVHQIIHHVDR